MYLIFKLILSIMFIGWLFWAKFAISYCNKLFGRELKYLFEADVNLLGTNKAASRYDPASLKKLEIYFGSVFLLPLRLLLVASYAWFGFGTAYLLYKLFDCKKNIFFKLLVSDEKLEKP